MRTVASALEVYPERADAIGAILAETGTGFEWGHLLVMAEWLVAGLLVGVRFFRWEPRR